MYPGQQGFNQQGFNQQGAPMQQPQYGQPQMGQPQMGQPQMGQPQMMQPQYGQPQMGQPQMMQQQYGQPNGQPQMMPQQYGQPQMMQQQAFGVGTPQFAQQQANLIAQQQVQAQMQAQRQMQPPAQPQAQYVPGTPMYPQAQQAPQGQFAPVAPAQQPQQGQFAPVAPAQQPQQGQAKAEQKTAEVVGLAKGYPNFDARADAKALRKAFKGIGCDQSAVNEIIGSRSNAQRQEIVRAYTADFKRDLFKDLKSELRGSHEDLAIALMKTPVEYDAELLRRAMKGIGCDKEILIEVLCTRPPAYLEEVKATFLEKYKRDLVSDVESETGSHLKKLLSRILKTPRDEDAEVDDSKAELDAKKLYDAGEGKWGTNQKEFIEIFASRSYAHLRVVFTKYHNVASRDIRSSIKREMSDSLIAQALMAIVGAVRELPYYFAVKLRDSMKGLGTKESTLIRILVSRSEIDLHDIKQEFARNSDAGGGQTLAKWIKDDAGGHFKKLLLQVVNA